MDGQREVARWPLSGMAIITTLLSLPFVITIVILLIAPAGGLPASNATSNGAALLAEYLAPFVFIISAIIVLTKATIHAREERRFFPSDIGYQRWLSGRNIGWVALAIVAWYGINVIVVILTLQGRNHGQTGIMLASSGQAPLINYQAPGFDRLLAAITGIICAPICEELVFRGFAYRALRSRLKVPAAAAIGGACFGLAHISTSAIWVMGILALDGVILCLVFEKTRSLFPGMLLHSLLNTIALTTEVHSFAYQVGCFLVFLVLAIILAPIAISRLEDSVRGPALPLPAWVKRPPTLETPPPPY